MSQFRKTLGFELKNNMNKFSIAITVIIMIIIAVILFIPRFFGGAAETDENSAADMENPPILLIKTDAAAEKSMVEKSFAKTFYDYKVEMTDDDVDTIKNEINSDKVGGAVVITGETEYTYYVKELTMSDNNLQRADETMLELYRTNALMEGGISEADAEKIMNTTMSGTAEGLKNDTTKSIIPTNVLLLLLFFVITLYGQKVATSVATEKSSRAMEMLITSAKPVNMLFGKVAACYLTGLIQMSAIIATALLCFNINKPYYTGNFLAFNMFFDIPPSLIAYILIFFLLGFLLYACLFGAFGSMASKAEQINTITMPISYLIIIVFFIIDTSIQTAVDSPLMVALSYIPFTSPLAMFARISMSAVPWYEIIISIAILIASVIGVGVLSAKIYRVGVLLYGNRPSVGTVLKSLRDA